MRDFKDIKEYFGIVKCVVEAPENMCFPVLPGKRLVASVIFVL